MSDAPSFLDATPAETAEFEAVRDEKPIVETPVAPPAEPKATEAPAEPEKAAEPPKPVEPAKVDERPKFVPHAALHEERTKRQAADARIAALEAALAARDGKAAGQPETSAQDLIDPEKDPIAALKQIRDFQQQQRQQGEMQRANDAFAERVQTHEADFAAATPDYGDAIAHLREVRAKEIVDVARTLGQTITQQQLAAQLRHEVLMTADVAFKAGKNPGEVFYELAKARGYALKAADPPPPPPPPDPEPAKQAAETIDRITRGQRASKVSGGDPPSGGGELSLEAISKLNGAAFDAAMEKFGKTQKDGERQLH